MEANVQAKDVAALFDRAGLGASATYIEFPKNRHTNGKEAKSGKAPAQSAAGGASAARLFKAGKADISCEIPAPALDRLLTGAPTHNKAEQAAYSGVTIAFFSLAGGGGKTTLATSLGRIVSGQGRRVVLANCASSFGFQHLVGSDAHRIGPLTFLPPPANVSALPLTLIDATETGGGADRESALKLIMDAGLHAHATFLDLPVTPSAHTREMLRMADQVLIPLLPDLNSAASLRSIESLMESELAGRADVHYVLNRYDPSRPLHCEMRDRLQSVLGGALLPIYIREEPLVQDAMRSGLTIVDYAPQSEVVTDLQALSLWIEQLLPRSLYLKGKTA